MHRVLRRWTATRFAMLGTAACGAAAYSFWKVSTKEPVHAYTSPVTNYKLRCFIDLSPDVRLFRFELPNPEELFVIPTMSALEIIHGDVTRQYTPVNCNGTKGYFDIVVKRLPNGTLTNHYLWRLKAGDAVQMRLRTLHFRYAPNTYKHIGLLCAGVGFTPMLQLARDIVTNPFDTTQCHMLYINRTEEDIVLKHEFDRLAAQYPEKFSITHLLSHPGATWTGHKGAITDKVVQEAFNFTGAPADKNIILVSGPDSFCVSVAGVTPSRQMSNPGRGQQPVRQAMIPGNLLGVPSIPAPVYVM